MAPNPRVSNAFRAMRSIGVKEEQVKPVLKNLLKLYERNWELIEAENYRALADAIFEAEDNKVEERNVDPQGEDMEEEEALVRHEPARPLKRLRLRHQEVQGSPSPSTSNVMLGGVVDAALKRPKLEKAPETSAQQHPQQMMKSTESRAEPCQVSLQHGTKNKGKQPVPSKPSALEERSDSLSHVAVRGTGFIPDSLALIKPKDEPFTDDMFNGDLPHYGAPIAMIHPDPSSKGNLPIENDEIGKKAFQESSSQFTERESRADCLETLSGDRRTNNELASVQEESNSNLEVVTSPLGEDGSVNVLPTLDALKRSTVWNVLSGNDDNLCMPSCTSNGLANTENLSAVPAEISRPPAPLNSLDDHVQASKRTSGNDCAVNDKDRKFQDPEYTNAHSLVVVPQCELTSDDLRSIVDINDVTKGEERFKISWVNELSSEFPESFRYIPQSIVLKNANVKFSLFKIGDESCCATCFSDCISASVPCHCAQVTGGEFAYSSRGLLKEQFVDASISMTRHPCLIFCKECPLERVKNDDCSEPCKGHLKRKFIKECWSKCGCSKQCGNRVVQRGITCSLQIFFTCEGKGWGLRTLEDLPKGAFVCEYVGEVLTSMELYERTMQRTKSRKCAYPVLLDADWGSNGSVMNEEALCLDASHYGNVARFINHRCLDANLIEIPVEVETPDHHYYHLAFFTTREVKAMEELTWDYGIDFDDLDQPFKPFQCRCGSSFCRNMKRSNRSRSTLTC